MEMLLWALLGGAIGVAAGKKKGFPMAGAVVGGILLGPLAVLMFAIAPSKEQRKCPHCAEWVKAEATVCKHCHKDIPPARV